MDDLTRDDMRRVRRLDTVDSLEELTRTAHEIGVSPEELLRKHPDVVWALLQALMRCALANMMEIHALEAKVLDLETRLKLAGINLKEL